MTESSPSSLYLSPPGSAGSNSSTVVDTTDEDQFAEWLAAGIEAGWVSPITCGMHDGTPMTEAEEAEYEQGFDPCTPIVRIWWPERVDLVKAPRQYARRA